IFDELPHFLQSQYMYLFSRMCRKEGFPLPVIMRATGAPPGPGHTWVKKRFIEPGHPSRPFVPARLEDLKGIIDMSDYDAKLEKLRETDPITYQQLRLGLWVLDIGGLI